MKSQIEIGTLIGGRQTNFLKDASSLLDQKLINFENKNRGNYNKYQFEIGVECKDIITYANPVQVKIVDRYSQNGWNFYQVTNGKLVYTLREKDIN